MIKRWATFGGVLLVSDKTLMSIVTSNSKNPVMLEQLQPHVLVLDEAHTMVRKSTNKIFKTLASFSTPRKIGMDCNHVFCSLNFFVPY